MIFGGNTILFYRFLNILYPIIWPKMANVKKTGINFMLKCE